MVISWEVHEGELVALGRGFLLAEFKAYFLVEVDGSGGVRDTNTGVEELDHGAEFGGK